MSFDSLGLAPLVLRAVADEGYTEPTSIQRQAIPLVLGGRDLLAAAQTGTGTTAAFGRASSLVSVEKAEQLCAIQRLLRRPLTSVLVPGFEPGRYGRGGANPNPPRQRGPACGCWPATRPRPATSGQAQAPRRAGRPPGADSRGRGALPPRRAAGRSAPPRARHLADRPFEPRCHERRASR